MSTDRPRLDHIDLGGLVSVSHRQVEPSGRGWGSCRRRTCRKVEAARGDRTDARVVQVMQNIEGTILDAAVRLDLIASIEQREPTPPREPSSLPTHRYSRWRILRAHHAEVPSASLELLIPEEKVSAPAFVVRTAASAATTGCEQQIHDRLAVRSRLADGPIVLEIAFIVDARRNWLNLSKAAIDTLDLLLGRTRSTRGRHPLDGWINELGLQRLRGQRLVGTDVFIYLAPQSIGRQAT
jgi:hypothetical protein